MEKAIYYQIDRWGWECPNCDNWNETNKDPAHADCIFCEKCDKYFEPILEPEEDTVGQKLPVDPS